MRRGIMTYNGKRYLQLSRERKRGHKPIAGFYECLAWQGVLIYTPDKELFAFISTRGERFVVDASWEGAKLKFGTTASHETLDRLGFASAVFGEERDAINGIKFS